MDWVITLRDADGEATMYRAPNDLWVGNVALAQRHSDAEKDAMEVPVDAGMPRWEWTRAD